MGVVTDGSPHDRWEKTLLPNELDSRLFRKRGGCTTPDVALSSTDYSELKEYSHREAEARKPPTPDTASSS